MRELWTIFHQILAIEFFSKQKHSFARGTWFSVVSFQFQLPTGPWFYQTAKVEANRF